MKNAKIVKTFLGREDHGIMTLNLSLAYDGSSQASQTYGGYTISDHKSPKQYRFGLDAISLLLDNLGAKSWEELAGTLVRVKFEGEGDDGPIIEIGHIMLDIWVNLAELAEKANEEVTGIVRAE